MRPKNLNVNHSSFLQNKIISKIYLQFDQVIKKIVGKKKFAIAVSGGPDSLALAYCAKIYSDQNNNQSFFLIIDHGIRKNSAAEAKSVQKNLLKINSISKILKVKKKIRKGIQKNARDERYKLMNDFCKKNKILFLLTAHHLDDQIENFYIRLSRGSGLYGLSSMKIHETNKNNINIIRPFLHLSKKELVYTATKVFTTFVKDPSNSNDLFLRSRIRKLKSSLAKEGLDQTRILKTITNLNTAKDAIDFYVKQSHKKHIRLVQKNKITIDKQLFLNQPMEITYRVMSELIRNKSKKEYPPRAKGLEHLISSIKGKKFSKVTLGGFVFSLDKNKIIMSKENRNAQ